MSCRHSSSPKDRPKWQGTEVSPPTATQVSSEANPPTLLMPSNDCSRANILPASSEEALSQKHPAE